VKEYGINFKNLADANLTVLCNQGVCRLDDSFNAEEHDVDGQFDKLPDAFFFNK
jgi:hypothetical protein